jgi:hypothetical protein
MRGLLLVALLVAAPTPARAENFIEVVGGILIPVADDDWTQYVESSPKLGVRAGTVDKFGGMLSIDWAPLNTDNGSFGFPGGMVDVSSHRFRILAMGTMHHRAGKLIATGRAGVGIDISHVSIQTTFLGQTNTNSDTDPGLALELGGGLWFPVGSVHVGGEIGIPLSIHADGEDNNINLDDYTSFDFDILFGVRFVSKP